jgi:voltage-gated potassium channel
VRQFLKIIFLTFTIFSSFQVKILFTFDQLNLMFAEIRRKVYLLLDPFEGNTKWDKVVNLFLITLIILNTIAVTLETVSSIYEPNQPLFKNFEIFSVFVFSIEYLLRIWTCTYKEKYGHPFFGRLKFIFSVGGLIDLFAILPFYLPFFIRYDLRFIRILRLIRFLRFFKLSRFMNASKVISKVVKAKKEELILSLLITLFLIIIASCTMFFVEHDAQPDKFSSIPETMWWSVATLTTVGYGDVFPITPLGKTLTAFISVLGIGMFALPAGIFASGFSDELNKNKAPKPKTCPHCNKQIN